MKKTLSFLTVLSALVACNSQNNSTANCNNDPKTKEQYMESQKENTRENSVWDYIEKNNWNLISLNGVNKNYENANIKFNTKENSVSGKTGCNGFMCNYQAEGEYISFTQMATTKMLCDEEANKTEMEFVQLLSGKKLRFDVADQVLNFYDGDKMVMMFGVVK